MRCFKMESENLIVITGVCASGKTTLSKGLQSLGLNAITVAQEHSVIKNMWNKKNPEIVIYLDATLQEIKKRKELYWEEKYLESQRQRLAEVRKHSDIYILTDDKSIEEVLENALLGINRIRGQKNDNTKSNHN